MSFIDSEDIARINTHTPMFSLLFYKHLPDHFIVPGKYTHTFMHTSITCLYSASVI